MAAITHVASAPYPSLSLSQNSTDSTLTGLHLSQAAPSPYEATRPANSSQTTISPTSRAHQQIMPMNMASFGPANGHHLQPATPRGLANINGHVTHQMYPSNYRPQIYTVSRSSHGDESSVLTKYHPQGGIFGRLSVRDGDRQTGSHAPTR